MKFIAQFGWGIIAGIVLAPIVAPFFPIGEAPTQEAVKPAPEQPAPMPANPALNDAVLVQNPQ
ncbi:MAG: hypothetical protein ACKO24_08085 [Leptolyngbyaceae cyanobacterium]